MTPDEHVAHCAMLDGLGRPGVPALIYDKATYDALCAAHGTAIGTHRLVYMAPQGSPANPKRTGYTADTKVKKARSAKWSPSATRASSLF